MQGSEPKELHLPETRVKKLFQNMHADGWTCDRITGSHHIFRKQGRRSIPIAVHGGHIAPGMARLVIRQIDDSQQNQRNIVVQRQDAKVEIQTTHRAKPKWSESGKERGRETITIVDASRPDSEPTAGSMDHDSSHQSASIVAQEQGGLDDISAQRDSWLETVHELIGSGAYEQLLAFLATPADSADSPSKLFNNFTWTGDLFFYRMFALCELALGSLSCINAPEHHNRIKAAFLSCTTMIERFPDRREESREYVRGIQARVFDQYCFFLTSQVNAQDELTFGADWARKIICGQQRQPVEQALTEVQTQQGREGQSLIAAGFIFIMKLKGSVPLPLKRGSLASFMPCIGVVSKRMLVCFDNGWYSEAEKLARLSVVFHKENRADSEVDAIARFGGIMGSIYGIHNRMPCSPTQLALVTTQFVLHLLPAQRYAEEHFEHFRQASYFYGLRTEESIDHARTGKLCQSEKLASYMARLFHAFDTVRCNQLAFHSFILMFTVDSLLDPLLLIQSRFEHLLRSDHHLQHFNDDFQRFAVKRDQSGQNATADEYAIIKADVLARQFQRVKYRLVVKELSRMLVWLVSLRELFAMTTGEPEVGTQHALRISQFAQDMHVGAVTSYRLKMLPKLFCQVFELLVLVSGVPTPCTSRFSSNLYFQLGILELDLEAQANWDVCGYDGGRCWGWEAGPSEEKRQSSQALSFVSFNANLQGSIPIVIFCSLTEKERKQMHVLNRMQGISLEDEVSVEAVSDTMLETSLWQTFLCLLWLTKSSTEVVEGKLRGMVESLVLDEIQDLPSRPGGATQMQALSVKSRKLIKRLQDAVAPHFAELEEARTESVAQLFAFYKESVLVARHMPKTLTETMKRGFTSRLGREEGLRKAVRFVKPWTLGEAAVVRGALIRFGKATEKLSRVIRVAFGGNLPVIHTIDSPEFELNHWQTRDQPPATARAIADLRVVREVLEKMRQGANSAVHAPGLQRS